MSDRVCPEQNRRAQFKFIPDSEGNIRIDAVASDAHERGKQETQGNLLDHVNELQAMKAWQSDDWPPVESEE